MRPLFALVLLSGGCSALLGISDPVASANGTPGGLGGDGGPGGDGSTSGARCTPPAGFAGPDYYPLAGTAGLLTTADFDHDGNEDVAVALTTKVSIYYGDGHGKLGRAQDFAFPANGVIGGDFDGDFYDDLVLWTAGGASVVVHRQDAAHPGTFLPAQVLPTTFSGIAQVASGLLDGNNVPDLIVEDGAELRVYDANLLFAGTFSKDDLIGTTGDQPLQLADFDHAGRDDIAFHGHDGAVAIAPQVNGVSFGTPVTVATVGTDLAVGLGHFEAGSAFDIVVATPVGGMLLHQPTTALSQFEPVTGTITGVSGSRLQVVDVDGDGRDDLVVDAGIVRQSSPGGFAPLAPCATTSATLFRDLDGNGKPEMLRIVDGQLEVRIQ